MTIQQIYELWDQYKLEIRGLMVAFIGKSTENTLNQQSTLDYLEGIATYASPMVTILTMLILMFTVLKMVDQYLRKEFNNSLFSLVACRRRRKRIEEERLDDMS